MIKVYLKQPFQAEQFDGSERIVDKYGIRRMPRLTKIWHIDAWLATSEGTVLLHLGDWIATGVNGERWLITDEVFKQKYKELPVIPENVAYIIKQAKKGDYKLGWVFHATYLEIWRVSVGNWIRTHADTVARAWLDGYTVEEDHE
ncbi:hypothetical protein TUA1478L_33850 [Lactiplantibacillus plantarum]